MTPTKLLSEPLAGTIDLSTSSISGLPDLSDEQLGISADEIRHLAAGTVYEPFGLPALREAIAVRYSELGLPTTSDDVLVTSGAQQAVSLLFSLFGRDHGTIVTENPTYAGAIDAARVAGATMIGLPIDEQGIKLRPLREIIDNSTVRLVYLMTTCQNPTGAVMGSARRHDIARLAESTGTFIVDDTSLADLVLDRTSHAFLASADSSTIITIGALSKLLWAGLRVGWIRAPAHLMARLARLKVISDLGSSHLSQILAARLLPTIEDTIAVRRSQLNERRAVLSGLLGTELPDWSWSQPAGGPFLWVRLPSSQAEAFARVALNHGVRVLAGTRSSPDETFGCHLRISFVVEPDELRVAAHRLCQAWTELRSSGKTARVAMDIVV
ncbi:PLP-dependent aminotransferase family protein [Kribbella sp. VKM Ac-2566]|uniref:aminotransferase-like domain-containing protein n=1 Tax=Kribbella sp. VKM Ac-2566 TaxID=2512218 RepID=UPI001EE14172|nr:PLP-dependent aminotransferase family protein [Kribbella sp. VKM Ac-2566]